MIYIALVQVQYSYTMFPKEVFGVRIDLQVIFVVKKVSNYESFRQFLVTQVTIVNKFFTYSVLLYAKKLYVLCSFKTNQKHVTTFCALKLVHLTIAMKNYTVSLEPMVITGKSNIV